MDSHIYNVRIDWSSDRKGRMCSADLNVDGNIAQCVEVATPPEFPNGMPGIWSPEHLFTAAVSSCLMTTFLAIAENSRLEFDSFNCDSEGRLEKSDGKYTMSEVILKPTVIIRDESQRDRALRVLQKAEANCLISNSVKSKISMQPMIEVRETIVA